MGDVAEAAKPDFVDLWVTEPPSNLGFAGSLNFIVRTRPAEPYWLIANADTRFGPGDLSRMASAMRPEPLLLGIEDFRVIGINAACVDTVGWWDENFHPCYCEDTDYRRRCQLAGVPIEFLNGTTSHVGSVSYRGNEHHADNARTYPRNVDYYVSKWGGWVGAERFATPFDRGGSVADWQLSRGRLASQAWR